MYIWEKYRTFEITSGIILKMNSPLYKDFTLEISSKWWPLTTLNRWPLYRIKIYSKMHRESTKVNVMSRWPLYKGDRYDRFDCNVLPVARVIDTTLVLLEPIDHKTKDFIISICCFSTKHTGLRSKNKDWLVWNRDVSEWNDMSTSRLLFLWASTTKIQLIILV